MKITKNEFNRFTIGDIPDNRATKKGVAGYHGLAKIIGVILSLKIFSKAVAVPGDDGVYYLNCKSLERWLKEVDPGIYASNPDLSKKTHDANWIKGAIASLVRSSGSQKTQPQDVKSMALDEQYEKTKKVPYPEKLGLLQDLAQKEHIESQYEIGVYLLSSSKEEALAWLQKAAEKGYVPAQTRLGSMYYSGTEVEKDMEKAKKWYALVLASKMYPDNEIPGEIYQQLTKPDKSEEPATKAPAAQPQVSADSAGQPSLQTPTMLQMPIEKVIASTPEIPEKFTEQATIEEQRLAHKKAKEFLQEQLPRVGASIDFVSSLNESLPQLQTRTVITGKEPPLDKTVFMSQYTKGVGLDIRKDGKRSEDNILVYVAASQFNGSEAPSPKTIKPGKAVAVYINDHTQGPDSQLAFPDSQVELLNCGGNIGYNALCECLTDELRSEIRHGYFMPTKVNGQKVIERLKSHGQYIEYPCIANVPKDIPKEGAKKVYQFLAAAPASGYNSVEGADCEEIQYWCALHAFRAQFKMCIGLAEKEKKPVILKAAAVGLGVFGNQPTNVAAAFRQAAIEYQAELKKNHVQVIFQIRNLGTPAQPASEMARLLQLKRIG